MGRDGTAGVTRLPRPVAVVRTRGRPEGRIEGIDIALVLLTHEMPVSALR